MITPLDPPGLKTFTGLRMPTLNPPLGLTHVAAVFVAAAFKEARTTLTSSRSRAVRSGRW
jgi:hypothetical protein